MTRYRATPKSALAPPVILTAVDHIDLGERIAKHLVNHKLLRPGIRFDAQVGTDIAAFRQDHTATVHVTIEEIT